MRHQVLLYRRSSPNSGFLSIALKSRDVTKQIETSSVSGSLADNVTVGYHKTRHRAAEQMCSTSARLKAICVADERELSAKWFRNSGAELLPRTKLTRPWRVLLIRNTADDVGCQ